MLQVESIVPGCLPSSVKGPAILVVNKANGDEEVVHVLFKFCTPSFDIHKFIRKDRIVLNW